LLYFHLLGTATERPLGREGTEIATLSYESTERATYALIQRILTHGYSMEHQVLKIRVFGKVFRTGESVPCFARPHPGPFIVGLRLFLSPQFNTRSMDGASEEQIIFNTMPCEAGYPGNTVLQIDGDVLRSR
jgi:hypothetical protein